MAVGAAIGAGVGGFIGGVASKMSEGNFWDGAGLLGAVTTDSLVDSGVYTYEAFKNGEQVAAKSVVSQVDEVVEGVGKVIDPDTIKKILATPKGSRPNPSTYLSKVYIASHLVQFDEGVTLSKQIGLIAGILR